uniref:Sodium channel toxin NaTx7 n=1 Tax=Odontobuthus doriae TaxID=342590 RepID=A0A0U4QF63_ODODO|nr:sodium channel toxin NaTx7 [Odontobuthus doriae]
MKLLLFGIILTLFSLIGSIGGADVPGNYPANVYGKKYLCGDLGENAYCRKVCKLHGVSYGYCFQFKCWCEYLKDKDISIWNAIKNHCTNTFLYPNGK